MKLLMTSKLPIPIYRIMMSSVTTIINAITYVLIFLCSITIVFIMIGVITLISVQERTKEIGILRAIYIKKKCFSMPMQKLHNRILPLP